MSFVHSAGWSPPTRMREAKGNDPFSPARPLSLQALTFQPATKESRTRREAAARSLAAAQERRKISTGLLEWCRRAADGDPDSRRLARELSEALDVLARFDEGPDLVLYYKRLMVLEGHAAYEHQLYSEDRLGASQTAFIDNAWRQFRAWWAGWPGAAS